MIRSFAHSALLLATIGFMLSVGCAQGEAPAERSQDLDSVAELAPSMVDENGQPYDYVYDANSPWLPATKRRLFKPLKADGYDDIRWYAPQNYAITEPPATGNVRPMVEWEAMKSLILQWPSGYLGNTSASKTFLDIAKNASAVADVWIITDAGGTNSLKQALAQNGVSNAVLASKFYFLETDLDSIWFIDSGPLPIIDKTKNTFSFADFRYYHERAYDDGVSTVLARNLTNMGMAANTATYRMPVNTEGGTFQGTSDGICFTGTRQLYYQSCDQGGCDKNTGGSPAWSGTKYVNINTVQNHSMNKQLKEEWGKYLGCKDVLVTHSVTDDGTGHLDMYFKVVDDNTILLGDYKPPYQANTAQAENAALLDETAAFLEAYTKPGGGKFTVHRMIMPGHRSTNEGMVPFTYLNSTFINGVNLWPAYSYPEWVDSRNEAESKWEEVMPNYQHIWINSETLSFWSGAIHCITRTVPDLSPGPWVADGTCNNDMCVAPSGGYDGDCTPNALQTAVCWGPDWVCACNDCDGPCADDAGPPPEGCGDISWEGCCEGNELKYCEGNQWRREPTHTLGRANRQRAHGCDLRPR
jgi:agmatine/peptidylarginine deiminase